jgi:hypothetical protein
MLPNKRENRNDEQLSLSVPVKDSVFILFFVCKVEFYNGSNTNNLINNKCVYNFFVNSKMETCIM